MSAFEIGGWVQGIVGDKPNCFGGTTSIVHKLSGAGYTPNYLPDELAPTNDPVVTPKPSVPSFDL